MVPHPFAIVDRAVRCPLLKIRDGIGPHLYDFDDQALGSDDRLSGGVDKFGFDRQPLGQTALAC
jgi:hypothetical protein